MARMKEFDEEITRIKPKAFRQKTEMLVGGGSRETPATSIGGGGMT
ncbi:hypothetical protein SAMN04488527_12045 [Aliiroseovarius crassostreae]|nr:hypothetical protein SAMN04488527_12045 [Aliiroseovarius crassostreae]